MIVLNSILHRHLYPEGVHNIFLNALVRHLLARWSDEVHVRWLQKVGQSLLPFIALEDSADFLLFDFEVLSQLLIGPFVLADVENLIE